MHAHTRIHSLLRHTLTTHTMHINASCTTTCTHTYSHSAHTGKNTHTYTDTHTHIPHGQCRDQVGEKKMTLSCDQLLIFLECGSQKVSYFSAFLCKHPGVGVGKVWLPLRPHRRSREGRGGGGGGNPAQRQEGTADGMRDGSQTGRKDRIPWGVVEMGHILQHARGDKDCGRC